MTDTSFAALQHDTQELNNGSEAQKPPKRRSVHVFCAAAQQYAPQCLVDDRIASVANYDRSPRAQSA
jgi:hypothetical protein